MQLVPFDSLRPRRVRKQQYRYSRIVVLSYSKDLEGEIKKN